MSANSTLPEQAFPHPFLPFSETGKTKGITRKHKIKKKKKILTAWTIGMYLIGSGVRSMFAAPFLETFGRNWVYFSTLTIFILFCLGMAIAPNYSAAIVFRFLVGFLAAAPLTVGGDTIADIRSLLEITFSLLFMTMTSYAGPILCPIIGAYLSILASGGSIGSPPSSLAPS